MAAKVLQDIETVLDGVKAVLSPQTQVRSIKSCDVVGAEFNEIERARTGQPAGFVKPAAQRVLFRV